MQIQKNGFTLIELLVTITLIGVLAGIVLVAINPQEQIYRARDADRKAGVSQLARAMAAYYALAISNHPAVNAPYPSAHLNGYLNPSTGGYDYSDGQYHWMDYLVTANLIKTKLPALGDKTPCSSRNVNNYCIEPDHEYPVNLVFVYTHLQSAVVKSQCGSKDPFYLWRSDTGQSGVVCGVLANNPPNTNPGDGVWQGGNPTFI